MNYILAEEQLNELINIHEHLLLFVDLSRHVLQDNVNISANALTGTFHSLECRLQKTLNTIHTQNKKAN